MVQRASSYDRIEGDTYVTPSWVYEALFKVESFVDPWDCAPAHADFDFLDMTFYHGDIASNPPFNLADEFIKHAIELAKPYRHKVAFLLPHTFDCAKSRLPLWEWPFKAKYVLTKRIRWANLEQKKNGPSTNHAWYVWDWGYQGPCILGYLK